MDAEVNVTGGALVPLVVRERSFMGTNSGDYGYAGSMESSE